MENFDQLKKILDEMPNKVCETGTIYDIVEDPSDEILNEGLKIIVAHNIRAINNLKKENETLRELIENAKEVEKIKEESGEDTQEETIIKKYPDVSLKLQTIIEQDKTESVKKIVSNLTDEECLAIKLELYKKIKDLEKQIHTIIMKSSTEDISSIQIELQKIKEIIKFLKPIEISKQEQEEQVNKVLVLPNNKNGSYLFDDIQNYPDRIGEIKTVLYKMFNGYFLKTKDIKSISNSGIKLAEYKSKTGLRVMYVVLPNDYVVIVTLFYKDKQRSSKITGYYEETEYRYNNMKEKLESRMQDADFQIEQAEMIGKICDCLEKNNKKNRGL